MVNHGLEFRVQGVGRGLVASNNRATLILSGRPPETGTPHFQTLGYFGGREP